MRLYGRWHEGRRCRPRKVAGLPVAHDMAPLTDEHISGPETGWEDFDFGFWHPFGWHGCESPQAIISPKRNETESNGWTLWSFQYRKMLDDFFRELSCARPKKVVVFCSRGNGAVDPAKSSHSKTIDCSQYKFVNGTRWQSIPSSIRVPHPFRPEKTLASAFVVRRIYYPVEFIRRPAAEWFSPNNGPWRQEAIPTRGEYLIRRGGAVPMRDVSAVLSLKPPYLAFVRRDPQ
jgi:hypothetical protein